MTQPPLTQSAGSFQEEIRRCARFSFGRNWASFLRLVDEERISEAEKSLREMLELADLKGRRFLDIGCGSGLFSLAARRLGATVHSFDYDSDSVACTRSLRARFFPGDPHWTVEGGSVLDRAYVTSLGQFDIVYSWGVLHHTGALWQALEIAAIPVASGGRLFISIYNDQGSRSKRWRSVKRFYCSGPIGRAVVCGIFIPCFILIGLSRDLGHGINPLRRYVEYKRSRGMSKIHDWVDWLGGYPFEVAKPEEVFRFLRKKGFALEQLTTWGGGLGCNQFVFSRS